MGCCQSQALFSVLSLNVEWGLQEWWWEIAKMRGSGFVKRHSNGTVKSKNKNEIKTIA